MRTLLQNISSIQLGAVLRWSRGRAPSEGSDPHYPQTKFLLSVTEFLESQEALVLQSDRVRRFVTRNNRDDIEAEHYTVSTDY